MAASRWLMDVKVYQNDEEVGGDHLGSPSGIISNIDKPGRTEIKIWKPGDAEPADSVWVNIVDGQILVPQNGQAIVSPFTVRWLPDVTPMTVQIYQQETLIEEYPDSPCGVEIEVDEPGSTEIKIWKSGAEEPSDAVTVSVSDDPQSLSWEIASPVHNQTVESPITVCWRPECGEMVVQFYRDYDLIAEKKDARSGDQFEISGEGEVEVKIWVPGASEPADSLWVHVIDDGSHKLPV